MSKAIDKAAGAERDVIGRHPQAASSLGNGLNMSGGVAHEVVDITTPATPEAARWQGWGTALKPGWEIIVVARKPLIGTVAANILQYGTGALNIDGCRIEGDVPSTVQGQSGNAGTIYGSDQRVLRQFTPNSAGRWPANVVLDSDAAAELDQQSGVGISRKGAPRGSVNPGNGWRMTETGAEYDDTGGASRFYFTAKASKRERPVVNGVAHPTVKPLSLMRWLVRLVTPPGGVVLDPFAGSGPTIEAALLEGFPAIGVEREAAYLPLIKARLSRIVQLPLDFTTGEG